jgi:hypothetical protein
MTKTNSDESLRVLLRLLIDEIVEDLSRRHRIQEQISSKTKPAWAMLRRTRFAGKAFSKDSRGVEDPLRLSW